MRPMVRALEARSSQSPNFLIIILLYNQNTIILFLSATFLVPSLLITSKHGIIFDDMSTLVTKLDNDMRGEGSTWCELQAFVAAVNPGMPKHEISPRRNDPNYVLGAPQLLAYHGLRLSPSQADAMQLVPLKALSMEPISDITERKSMLRAF